MVLDKRTANWLHKETGRWIQTGIIDNSQAEAIKALYPLKRSEKPWGLLVFSGIGAVIIGLGVILLFAYNWEDMSKFAKLTVVFGSLIASHAVGMALFLKSERFKGLGEAIAVLGTMFFGAGIWLVAAIYHIEEHFPNAFFIWAVGALLLAFVMPSIMQAILAAVLIAIWTCAESIGFDRAMFWAVPLLLSIFVLAHQRKSNLLIAVSILCLAVTAVSLAGSYLGGDFVLLVLLSLSACYMAAGHIFGWYGKFKDCGGVYKVLGFAGYLIFLYILCFDDVVKEIYGDIPEISPAQIVFFLLPVALAVIGWIWVFGKMFLTGEFKKKYELLLIPLVLVFGCWQILMYSEKMPMPAAVFNIVFLAQSVLIMGRGCKDGQISPTILGSIMLIALTIGRYTDLFESLITRGIVFIVVGLLIFAQGIFYIRSKKKLRAETEAAG